MSKPPRNPSESAPRTGPRTGPRTDSPPADAAAADDTRRSGMGAVVLHHSVTALMLMLIIALGVWSYLSFRTTSFFQAPAASESSRVEAFVEEAQKQRIRFALRVFHRLDGRYPLTLDELVERNLLLPSDLEYPSGASSPGARFSYQREADGYTLQLARTLPETPQPLD
jgi:hypothetical protein